MSETAVKEAICDVCGADVRDGSVFCYNCGSAVKQQTEQIVVQKTLDEIPSSDALSNGNSVNKDSEKVLPKQMPDGRRRPRKRHVKTSEVAWEEREGMSVGFIATTIVLVLLSAAILIAGFYFR